MKTTDNELKHKRDKNLSVVEHIIFGSHRDYLKQKILIIP